MARPKNLGIEYFSLDVDFFEDEKLVAIANEYGLKGEITAIKLLCAVYRNGYFIEWNAALKTSLLRRLGSVSPGLLDQIISGLVKWGLFDRDLFHTAAVLTSAGIQRRWREATKRRSKPENLKYWLLEDKKLLSTLCIQKPTKESKVKESNNAIALYRTREEFLDAYFSLDRAPLVADLAASVGQTVEQYRRLAETAALQMWNAPKKYRDTSDMFERLHLIVMHKAEGKPLCVSQKKTKEEARQSWERSREKEREHRREMYDAPTVSQERINQIRAKYQSDGLQSD